MVTVQQVFDIAIYLIDEQSESTGSTMTVDTQEYKFRALPILNSIIPGLYPYSGNYNKGTSGRPSPRQLDTEDPQNPDMDQRIPLDDTLSLSVLPYYLAARLVFAENEELAAWMKNEGREMLLSLQNKVPADFEQIVSPYSF